MEYETIKCPSCGASVHFKPGKSKAICEYCGSTVVSEDYNSRGGALELADEINENTDFSIVPERYLNTEALQFIANVLGSGEAYDLHQAMAQYNTEVKRKEEHEFLHNSQEILRSVITTGCARTCTSRLISLREQRYSQSPSYIIE